MIEALQEPRATRFTAGSVQEPTRFRGRPPGCAAWGERTARCGGALSPSSAMTADRAFSSSSRVLPLAAGPTYGQVARERVRVERGVDFGGERLIDHELPIQAGALASARARASRRRGRVKSGVSRRSDEPEQNARRRDRFADGQADGCLERLSSPAGYAAAWAGTAGCRNTFDQPFTTSGSNRLRSRASRCSARNRSRRIASRRRASPPETAIEPMMAQ